MKKYSIILALMICLATVSVFVLSSCDKTSEDPIAEIEKQLLGTWETHFNDHTTIYIFETKEKGIIKADNGRDFEFTYKVLNDHQIEETMVTIENVEKTSIYEFELNGDTLMYDGMDFVRK